MPLFEPLNERIPILILVEGQSSVSHPAFMSSVGILKGCMPDGVILQHPPSRKFRCDFPLLPMPSIVSEIRLIREISQSQVIAIALSHENMTATQMQNTIKSYEDRLLLLGYDPVNRQAIPKLHTNAFKLIAEVIESKIKPSLPFGEIGQDSFGNIPVFCNRGTHQRA